jgi:ABC-type transport system substrate-binding protein
MLRVQIARALACTLALYACDGPGQSKTSAPESGEAPAEGTPVSPAEDAGSPVRGDWLVIHSLADPENLNPLTSNDAGASQVLGWIFPTLVRIDQNTLALEPLLASELPEVSPDRLTYTYRLRDYVTFSDGSRSPRGRGVHAQHRHPIVNAAPQHFTTTRSRRGVVDPHTVASRSARCTS